MYRLGITFSGEVSLPKILDYAKRAEEKGFDSVWMAEHYLLRDAFTCMASAAAVTKRIKIGAGVVNPYTRSIALIAMGIATVDELSTGRAILGLGSTTRFWKTLGIHDDKPVATLRESIATVRSILKGETVNLGGRRETLNQIRLGFQPQRGGVPIYIGALQRRMLQLAGEVADGVLLSNAASVDHVKFAKTQVLQSASKVGRSVEEVDVACCVMTWLSEDAAKAVPQIKRQIAAFLAVPGREVLFGEEGGGMPKVTSLIKTAKQGKLDEAAAMIDDEILNLVTVSGTRQECARRFEEYIQAGAQALILRPVVTEPTKLIDAFSPT